MIKMIVAHDLNRAIGKDNKLMWNIPKDLQFFKKITSGSTIVMGRKTYESIGRVLPNRDNIIITRDWEYRVEGALTFTNIQGIVEFGKFNDVYIIGGGELYAQFLPYVEELFVTQVFTTIEDADTFFPEYEDKFDKLIEGAYQGTDEGLEYSFNYYRKKLK